MRFSSKLNYALLCFNKLCFIAVGSKHLRFMNALQE